ncbi:glycerol-3-phosphate 1-O-acyltransferase PlsY [Desulfoscipio gibsoniae]|uniref:Glycerol-3-phosphate acyltransferase n=1 Tax=Desulfoscipio gibsoniae DSM 7213 TaxID=767817 RepID=R4KH47_9FIRM|nr:glycerol-3-phosphate 1-O-acyltransferase PlsY [Desulfoscipio gibsoniae]AGL01939.1 acyl-phosphate glycerol 3-phosphate acyltransferase [Desulfoscipio gibsoniae DSM 7213]
MYILLAVMISYLIGSIPVGVLVARTKGINIMEHGSGNIGTTNVWRNLGPGYGLFVLALDMAKGVTAVLVGRYFGGVETELLAAFGALCGHSWSVFLRFKGGKIVATGAGVVLAISPLVTLVALVVLLTTLGISRYVSLSSMMAAITVPTAMAVLGMDRLYIIFGIILMIFVIYKHRSNIQRILSGTEYKVGKGRRI